MTNEVKTNPNGSRKTKKILLWTFITSAGLVLLIFFGLPLFLSSSGGTKMLLGKINDAVDGQIQMDDFSMGWFKGVQLTNVSYDDSAGTTSVKVQRIETQPSYTSLLGGKVKLGKTIVRHPEVYLKVLPEEEHPGMSEGKTPTGPAESKPIPAFPVHQVDLELIDGTATVELVGDVSQTVTFTNIASKVQLAEPGGRSTLDVSMEMPNDKGSTISAKGSAATDKTGWTIKDGNFDVKIENLQLGSLKPLLALAGQDMDAEGQLNADANIEIKENQLQHVLADAVITDFAQGTGDERVAFDKPVQIHASVQGSGKDLLVEKAYIKSQFCQVDCFGSAESIGYEVDADLAQTQRFIGQFVDMQGMTMAGELAAKGTVSIAADKKISVAGDGMVQKLIVQKEGVSTPETNAKLSYDCTVDQAASRLQIASADLTATPGTVNISNLIVPMSKQGPQTISLDARAKLDLAQAWSFAQVFADLPEDTTISGMLDSTVQATTTDSQVRLLIDKTQIDKLKIQQGKEAPFTQNRVSLAGDVSLDLEAKQYDIKKLTVQGDDKQLLEVTKGTVTTQTADTTTTVAGDFEVAYDWKTLSAFASPYMPEGLALTGRRTDKLQFKSEYPTDNPELLKANLDANATFGFASAAYNGFNFGPTSMTMTVNQGILDFDIPQATVNEGKFQFAGQVDLNADSKVLRLKKPMQVLEGIHINEQITRTMLARLNPVFAEQGNVSGFANLKCNKLEIPFKIDQEDKILLDGVIQIDKGQLEPTGFLALVLGEKNVRPVETKLLPTHVLVKNKVASYNDMELHVDVYPIGFMGKTRFDGYADLKIALPKRFDVENVRLRSVKVGDDLSKRIVVECQGYLQDFANCIRYDKLLEGILGGEGVIEDATRRIFEKIFD